MNKSLYAGSLILNTLNLCFAFSIYAQSSNDYNRPCNHVAGLAATEDFVSLPVNHSKPGQIALVCAREEGCLAEIQAEDFLAPRDGWGCMMSRPTRIPYGTTIMAKDIIAISTSGFIWISDPQKNNMRGMIFYGFEFLPGKDFWEVKDIFLIDDAGPDFMPIFPIPHDTREGVARNGRWVKAFHSVGGTMFISMKSMEKSVSEIEKNQLQDWCYVAQIVHEKVTALNNEIHLVCNFRESNHDEMERLKEECPRRGGSQRQVIICEEKADDYVLQYMEATRNNKTP